MSTNKVEFIPASQYVHDVVPAPRPAIEFFPEWMKKIPPIPTDADSPKMCTPFMDTFSTGYIQELTCDVRITNLGKGDNGRDLIQYGWSGAERPMSTRYEEGNGQRVIHVTRFDGYYYSEQHWVSFWEPKTPKGYSSFYCHPLNRMDLPFLTMSGIIDTDSFNLTGPVPFLIKEGFQGVIPAGTPIYQVFFIKRDHWKSSIAEFDQLFRDKMNHKVKRFFRGGYKNQFWTKKVYD